MADNYYSDRTTMYIGKQIEMSSTRMFQSVVHQNVLNNVDINSLVNINYNTDSNVSSVIINTKLVNQILLDANYVLSEVFYEHLDEYFTDLEIPIGTMFSKSLFAGMGPNIKIPITPVGSYKVDILTNTVPYGINNSLIELSLPSIDIPVNTPAVAIPAPVFNPAVPVPTAIVPIPLANSPKALLDISFSFISKYL